MRGMGYQPMFWKRRHGLVAHATTVGVLPSPILRFHVMRIAWPLLAALLLATPCLAADAPQFEKHVLTTDYLADGVTTADVNRDGHLDVIAGPYWYAGPDFKTR